jgi:5-methylcytosine-specific restriction enzyme A
MPTRPLHPCNRPSCPKLTNARFCPEHAEAERQRYEATRTSASDRGYGRTWRKRRANFLDRHPLCEDCGEPSTDADHVPSRRELVARGEVDPDADEFLHARCHRHHSSKTARHDKRWGRGGRISRALAVDRASGQTRMQSQNEIPAPEVA